MKRVCARANTKTNTLKRFNETFSIDFIANTSALNKLSSFSFFLSVCIKPFEKYEIRHCLSFHVFRSIKVRRNSKITAKESMNTTQNIGFL